MNNNTKPNSKPEMLIYNSWIRYLAAENLELTLFTVGELDKKKTILRKVVEKKDEQLNNINILIELSRGIILNRLVVDKAIDKIKFYSRKEKQYNYALTILDTATAISIALAYIYSIGNRLQFLHSELKARGSELNKWHNTSIQNAVCPIEGYEVVKNIRRLKDTIWQTKVYAIFFVVTMCLAFPLIKKGFATVGGNINVLRREYNRASAKHNKWSAKLKEHQLQIDEALEDLNFLHDFSENESCDDIIKKYASGELDNIVRECEDERVNILKKLESLDKSSIEKREFIESMYSNDYVEHNLDADTAKKELFQNIVFLAKHLRLEKPVQRAVKIDSEISPFLNHNNLTTVSKRTKRNQSGRNRIRNSRTITNVANSSHNRTSNI